jgi:hypothetical protein
MRFYIASMRITTHGNDLLITDQSIGFGAALLSIGVLLLVSCLDRLISGGGVGAAVFAGGAGALAIKLGFARLVATQLIVDPEDRLIITRRWSFLGADDQRIPFDAVNGFNILPDGKDKGTWLMIDTTRGPVPASGGAKAVRAAWEEVIAAVEAHMQR